MILQHVVHNRNRFKLSTRFTGEDECVSVVGGKCHGYERTFTSMHIAYAAQAQAAGALLAAAPGLWGVG